jgi:hypothetical protein
MPVLAYVLTLVMENDGSAAGELEALSLGQV